MTIDEMKDLLERLNIPVTGVNGGEVGARCPGHFDRTGKQDRNPSWSINAATGAHRCWSCGFRGSLQFLVSYVGGIEVEEVSEWVKTNSKALTMAFERMLNSQDFVEEKIEVLEESMLALYTTPPAHVLKARGITLEAAQQCEVLWDPRKECWILPIREPIANSLWGWQEKAFIGRWFRNQPEGVKKSRTLFNINRYSGPMVLVESPLDVARLASVGVYGGVAAMGALVSKDQLLCIENADKLIVALDNDDAGHKASEELLNWAKAKNKGIWFFSYTHTDMKDVGGMSKSEILQGLDEARHSIRGKKALA